MGRRRRRSCRHALGIGVLVLRADRSASRPGLRRIGVTVGRGVGGGFLDSGQGGVVIDT